MYDEEELRRLLGGNLPPIGPRQGQGQMSVRADALPALLRQPGKTRLGLSGPELQNAMLARQEQSYSTVAPHRPAGVAGSTRTQVPVPSLLELSMGNRGPVVPEDDHLTPAGLPAPSEIKDTAGFFAKISDALANPNAQKLLSQIGMSLTAREQDSFAYQLNAANYGNATDKLTAQALQKALRGEELTAEDLAGLPPEQRQEVLAAKEQVNRENVQERQLGQEDTRIANEGERTKIAQGQLDLAREGQDFNQEQAQQAFSEEVRQFDEGLRVEQGKLGIQEINAQSGRISAGAQALNAKTNQELGKVQARLGELQIFTEEGEALGLSQSGKLGQMTELSRAGQQLSGLVEGTSKAIEALSDAKLNDPTNVAAYDANIRQLQSVLDDETLPDGTIKRGALSSLRNVNQTQAALMSEEGPKIVGEGDTEALAKIPAGEVFIYKSKDGAAVWNVKAPDPKPEERKTPAKRRGMGN